MKRLALYVIMIFTVILLFLSMFLHDIYSVRKGETNLVKQFCPEFNVKGLKFESIQKIFRVCFPENIQGKTKQEIHISFEKVNNCQMFWYIFTDADTKKRYMISPSGKKQEMIPLLHLYKSKNGEVIIYEESWGCFFEFLPFFGPSKHISVFYNKNSIVVGAIGGD